MYNVINIYEISKRFVPSFINHGNIYFGNLLSYEESIELLKTKKILFCTSVGREGSAYVASVFSHSNNVLSRHEDRPFCTGEKLIKNAFFNPEKDKKIYIRKIRAIATNIKKSNANTYVETNHMFLKTFGQYFINYTDIEFDVLSIRRNISMTVKSFYNLEWFSRKYNRTKNWIYKISNISPLKRSFVKINNEIDEIIAYVISEKIREVLFKNILISKGFKYLPINVPLNHKDMENIKTLFNIEIEENAVSKKVNRRENVKSRNVDLYFIKQNIFDFLEKNSNILKGKYNIEFNDKSIYIENEEWKI